MKLSRDPFPLIFSQGDETIRLVTLQLFELGDSPEARRCLLELIKQQRADGPFPSRLDPLHWGMRETVRNTLLLLKAGLPPQGTNVQSATTFILNHQRPDGGWSENPALMLPPEQTWLSNQRSITWLTADVVDLLCKIGMEESPRCQAALAWLMAMQNRRGGWPSLAGEDIADPQDSAADPDATALITFLIGEVYGQHDQAYLKGKELFESHLAACAQDASRGYWVRFRDGGREKLDVYHLTHLLLSRLLDSPRRIHSGYDVNDPRVRQMMETLIDIQGKDGGWRPFFAQESSPLYTALAVRVLVLSRMLAPEELKPTVDPYAV
jgi:hypothetical protein